MRFEEPFTSGGSYLHGLDAAWKLAGAMGPIFVVALTQSTVAAIVGFVIAAVLLLSSRPPLRPLVKRAAAVNGFIAFLWLFLPWTYPGAPVFTLGPLTATDQGLHLALLITIKSNAVFFFFIATAATSHVPELGKALKRLGLPTKFCFLLLFTYRYISVIGEEYEKLSKAAKIRCFRPKTSVRTYRTYAQMIGMVLVKSYDRSQRIHEAMLMRGFNGRFHVLTESRTGMREILYFVTSLVLTAGLVHLSFSG